MSNKVPSVLFHITLRVISWTVSLLHDSSRVQGNVSSYNLQGLIKIIKNVYPTMCTKVKHQSSEFNKNLKRLNKLCIWYPYACFNSRVSFAVGIFIFEGSVWN